MGMEYVGGTVPNEECEMGWPHGKQDKVGLQMITELAQGPVASLPGRP